MLSFHHSLLTHAKKAFTLAELLIALAMIGLFATYTIPKVLGVQGNSKQNTQTLEVASMITAAYQKHQQAGLVTVNTVPGDLIQYLNYAGTVPNGTQIDLDPLNGNGPSWSCSALQVCIKLHSGGILLFQNSTPMTRLIPNEFVSIFYDPDGVASGISADSPSSSVWFLLYYSGRITSGRFIKATDCIGPYCPIGGWGPSDPSWFHWN
jgi:prepilin-type N-terminal cleavage/methylation domain-containing protein